MEKLAPLAVAGPFLIVARTLSDKAWADFSDEALAAQLEARLSTLLRTADTSTRAKLPLQLDYDCPISRLPRALLEELPEP